MAPEKVTKMVVDVDLKCSDCYNKVRKVICKIPEIRDQEYDFDKNKVKISVVCCCPERVRDKLSYKGGKSVQKIEIVVADHKPKEKTSVADDDKPLKPKPKPKESDKPKGENNDKPKAAAKAPGDIAAPKTKTKSEVAKMMFEPPVEGYPQMYPPMTTNYPMVSYGYQQQQQQQQGYGGVPFQHYSGYGMPVASSSSRYEYGYAYNNHGYNGNGTNNNNYLSEENQQECSIM